MPLGDGTDGGIQSATVAGTCCSGSGVWSTEAVAQPAPLANARQMPQRVAGLQTTKLLPWRYTSAGIELFLTNANDTVAVVEQ